MSTASGHVEQASEVGVSRRIWVVSAVMAVPLGVLALGLLWVVHEATHIVWHSIPHWLHQGDQPASWYVVGVPTLGGVLAAVLLTRAALPDHEGLSLTPVALKSLPWIIAAALVTLSAGFVVGPEAPLLAMSIALAAVAGRTGGLRSEAEQGVIALAGAFAVLATILVSPLVTLVLLAEIIAATGRVPARKLFLVLLPGLLSGAIAVLVFAGVQDWGGFPAPTLALPELPAYPALQFVDVMWAVPVAVVTAFVLAGIQRVTGQLSVIVSRYPIRMSGVLGALVGICAIAYRAFADRPVEDVLQSGQAALPELVAIGSAATLLLIVAFKSIAYACSLAARVEGGPIFPVVAIATALGVAASMVLPGAAMVPMLAVAIAAGTAGIQRLPIFGLAFAIVIVGTDHALEVTTFCVIGAVIGTALAARRNEPTTA